MDRIIDLLLASQIFQKKSVKIVLYVSLGLFTIFSIFILSGIFLSLEDINYERISILMPLITYIGILLALLFLISITAIGSENLKGKLQNTIEELYEIIDKNIDFIKQKGFKKIGKKSSHRYKNLLSKTYQDNQIIIGINYEYGNLFINFPTEGQRGRFKTINMKFLDTDDTTISVYLEQDVNLFKATGEEIMLKLEEYMNYIDDFIKN